MIRFRKIILISLLFLFLGTKMAFGADGLQVHFIDVGQADAALIICEGHAMMIDGGEVNDSQLIYSYLQKQNIRSLDYIVVTHDDTDHIGGLPAAVTCVGPGIGMVLAPFKNSDKERFRVLQKKLAENKKAISVPMIDTSYRLGPAEFRFLSLGEQGADKCLVLRLKYGENTFLFAADADAEQEKAILDSGLAEKCTVLKVGHHGSSTSTSLEFLQKIDPSYAVISVGKDNPYGHPAVEVLERLKKEGVNVYRTDRNGTIIFSGDGKKLSVKAEKATSQKSDLIAFEADPSTASAVVGTAVTRSSAGTTSGTSATVPPEIAPSTYVLNKNTKKFHRPFCPSAAQIKGKNKEVVTDTRDHITSMGYVPCKNCNP